MEREAIAEQQRREQEEERCRVQAHEQPKLGIYYCPCGFSGKPTIKARGSILLTLILLCFCVVPAVIYVIVLHCSGSMGVCPSCGRTLAHKYDYTSRGHK